MTDQNTILQIEDLVVSFGALKALNGLSLTLKRGSVCAFIGSNGAGKTTTFATIAGFIPEDSGKITIDGKSRKQYVKEGGLIGLLPQDVSFFEERTIRSQLFFLSRLSGVSKKDAKKEVEEVLEKTKLTEKANSYPSQLSRGMKVRLGIAQAILGRPPLILLDEPSAGLDPLCRKDFYELVDELKKETTLVISSHHLNELETLCDQVCIIEKGKVLEQQSMRNFLVKDNSVNFYVSSRDLVLQEIKNTFPHLFFDFDYEKRVLSITNPHTSDLTVTNREIFLWLIHHHIDVMEIRRDSSLTQRYLDCVHKEPVK